ncbi:unnamed protein product [Caenorhabditis nigoni]
MSFRTSVIFEAKSKEDVLNQSKKEQSQKTRTRNLGEPPETEVKSELESVRKWGLTWSGIIWKWIYDEDKEEEEEKRRRTTDYRNDKNSTLRTSDITYFGLI